MIPERWRRRLLTMAAVVFLVSVGAFAFGPTIERKLFGKAPPSVATLQHINQLRTAFNRDAGSERLILIFSPT